MCEYKSIPYQGRLYADHISFHAVGRVCCQGIFSCLKSGSVPPAIKEYLKGNYGLAAYFIVVHIFTSDLRLIFYLGFELMLFFPYPNF